MKKTFLLTSLLALSACGGGSGGGANTSYNVSPITTVTDARPAITIATTDINPTVSNANSNLTGMAAYTVSNADDVKSAMNTYVAEKLGSSIYTAENYNDLNRAATRRRAAAAALTDAQKFEIANAKIIQMKQVLHDMATTDDVEAYVSKYKKYVAEALTLWGAEDVNSSMSNSDLIAKFNALEITSDTLSDKLADFDHDNAFEYNKETFDNVQFKGSGEDAYFKFTLGDDDTITSVSRMVRENPSDEYALSDEGVFVRQKDTNGNYTKDFKATNYEYVFDLGTSGLGEDYSAFESNLSTIKFTSTNGSLSDANLKTNVLAELQQEYNDVLASQPTNCENCETKLTAVYNAYVAKINGTDGDEVDDWAAMLSDKTVSPFYKTVTMVGLGKDFGLKYADFGYAQLDEEDDNHNVQTMYSPYAGGYTSRIVNADKVEEGAQYSGTALLTVETSTYGGGHTEKEGTLFKNEGAILSYDGDGVHTLTMDNLVNMDDTSKKWYDVSVSGNTVSGDVTFTVSGTTNATDFKMLSDDGRENYAVTKTFANGGGILNQQDPFDNEATDGTYSYHGNAEIEYYGPDANTADEALTRFGFSENDSTTNKEVAIYGIYGGKKIE